ncbi:MAG: hypothetical protein ACRDE2_00140 [Chitinophagaceae bacterium]
MNKGIIIALVGLTVAAGAYLFLNANKFKYMYNITNNQNLPSF